MSATAATATVEAISHRDYSPSTIAIAPGARIELSGYEWGLREIMVTAAGPIADKVCPCPTFEAEVARHEAAHLLLEFLTGAPMRGASIIAAPGHSAGRTSTRMPPPGAIPISDEERIKSYLLLGGGHFDPREIEAFVTTLLLDYLPLARRLTAVLVERKVLTGRQVRRILLRAMKRDLRRAKIVAEMDQRAQAAFAIVLRKELRA